MAENREEILREKLDPQYPKGFEEVAELLDFLPEQARLATAEQLIRLLIST
ncbi:MAG: hypothetical protein FWG30_11345 [Eubacteriaceae bacterium]|nr:hypothetical protein [Eubacteriaceae bacterium]